MASQKENGQLRFEETLVRNLRAEGSKNILQSQKYRQNVVNHFLSFGIVTLTDYKTYLDRVLQVFQSPSSDDERRLVEFAQYEMLELQVVAEVLDFKTTEGAVTRYSNFTGNMPKDGTTIGFSRSASDGSCFYNSIALTFNRTLDWQTEQPHVSNQLRVLLGSWYNANKDKLLVQRKDGVVPYMYDVGENVRTAIEAASTTNGGFKFAVASGSEDDVPITLGQWMNALRFEVGPGVDEDGAYIDDDQAMRSINNPTGWAAKKEFVLLATYLGAAIVIETLYKDESESEELQQKRREARDKYDLDLANIRASFDNNEISEERDQQIKERDSKRSAENTAFDEERKREEVKSGLTMRARIHYPLNDPTGERVTRAFYIEHGGSAAVQNHFDWIFYASNAGPATLVYATPSQFFRAFYNKQGSKAQFYVSSFWPDNEALLDDDPPTKPIHERLVGDLKADNYKLANKRLSQFNSERSDTKPGNIEQVLSELQKLHECAWPTAKKAVSTDENDEDEEAVSTVEIDKDKEAVSTDENDEDKEEQRTSVFLKKMIEDTDTDSVELSTALASRNIQWSKLESELSSRRRLSREEEEESGDSLLQFVDSDAVKPAVLPIVNALRVYVYSTSVSGTRPTQGAVSSEESSSIYMTTLDIAKLDEMLSSDETAPPEPIVVPFLDEENEDYTRKEQEYESYMRRKQIRQEWKEAHLDMTSNQRSVVDVDSSYYLLKKLQIAQLLPSEEEGVVIERLQPAVQYGMIEQLDRWTRRDIGTTYQRSDNGTSLVALFSDKQPDLNCLLLAFSRPYNRSQRDVLSPPESYYIIPLADSMMPLIGDTAAHMFKTRSDFNQFVRDARFNTYLRLDASASYEQSLSPDSKVAVQGLALAEIDEESITIEMLELLSSFTRYRLIDGVERGGIVGPTQDRYAEIYGREILQEAIQEEASSVKVAATPAEHVVAAWLLASGRNYTALFQGFSSEAQEQTQARATVPVSSTTILEKTLLHSVGDVATQGVLILNEQFFSSSSRTQPTDVYSWLLEQAALVNGQQQQQYLRFTGALIKLGTADSGQYLFCVLSHHSSAQVELLYVYKDVGSFEVLETKDAIQKRLSSLQSVEFITLRNYTPYALQFSRYAQLTAAEHEYRGLSTSQYEKVKTAVNQAFRYDVQESVFEKLYLECLMEALHSAHPSYVDIEHVLAQCTQNIVIRVAIINWSFVMARGLLRNNYGEFMHALLIKQIAQDNNEEAQSQMHQHLYTPLYSNVNVFGDMQKALVPVERYDRTTNKLVVLNWLMHSNEASSIFDYQLRHGGREIADDGEADDSPLPSIVVLSNEDSVHLHDRARIYALYDQNEYRRTDLLDGQRQQAITVKALLSSENASFLSRAPFITDNRPGSDEREYFNSFVKRFDEGGGGGPSATANAILDMSAALLEESRFDYDDLGGDGYDDLGGDYDYDDEITPEQKSDFTFLSRHTAADDKTTMSLQLFEDRLSKSTSFTTPSHSEDESLLSSVTRESILSSTFGSYSSRRRGGVQRVLADIVDTESVSDESDIEVVVSRNAAGFTRPIEQIVTFSKQLFGSFRDKGRYSFSGGTRLIVSNDYQYGDESVFGFFGDKPIGMSHLGRTFRFATMRQFSSQAQRILNKAASSGGRQPNAAADILFPEDALPFVKRLYEHLHPRDRNDDGQNEIRIFELWRSLKNDSANGWASELSKLEVGGQKIYQDRSVNTIQEYQSLIGVPTRDQQRLSSQSLNYYSLLHLLWFLQSQYYQRYSDPSVGMQRLTRKHSGLIGTRVFSKSSGLKVTRGRVELYTLRSPINCRTQPFCLYKDGVWLPHFDSTSNSIAAYTLCIGNPLSKLGAFSDEKLRNQNKQAVTEIITKEGENFVTDNDMMEAAIGWTPYHSQLYWSVQSTRLLVSLNDEAKRELSEATRGITDKKTIKPVSSYTAVFKTDETDTPPRDEVQLKDLLNVLSASKLPRGVTTLPKLNIAVRNALSYQTATKFLKDNYDTADNDVVSQTFDAALPPTTNALLLCAGLFYNRRRPDPKDKTGLPEKDEFFAPINGYIDRPVAQYFNQSDRSLRKSGINLDQNYQVRGPIYRDRLPEAALNIHPDVGVELLGVQSAYIPLYPRVQHGLFARNMLSAGTSLGLLSGMFNKMDCETRNKNQRERITQHRKRFENIALLPASPFVWMYVLGSPEFSFVEVDARMYGNLLRYVRYTNEREKANVEASPVASSDSVTIYWQLRTTRHVPQDQELLIFHDKILTNSLRELSYPEKDYQSPLGEILFPVSDPRIKPASEPSSLVDIIEAPLRPDTSSESSADDGEDSDDDDDDDDQSSEQESATATAQPIYTDHEAISILSGSGMDPRFQNPLVMQSSGGNRNDLSSISLPPEFSSIFGGDDLDQLLESIIADDSSNENFQI